MVEGTLLSDTAGGTDHVLDVGGQRITFRRWGQSGPCVLALHGIPGWRGTWNSVGEKLASRVQLVAPDMLGFGQSQGPATDGHAQEQAHMLARFVDALGWDGVHLVGFDFGGPVTVLLAQQLGNRVRSVCLAATNVLTDNPVPPPLLVARIPLLGEAFFRVAFGRAGLGLMWRAAVGDTKAFPRAAFNTSLHFPQGVRSTQRIFLQSLRNLRRLYQPIEDALPSITAPCTVLWGSRDPFFSVAAGKRTAAAIPSSTFILLEGCGHFVPEEKPEAMAQGITAGIERARKARSQQ